jgi:predicted nucleotidyltransferase component of viral defense system
MDLDIWTVSVDTLKRVVMKIIESHSFGDTLKPFGIEKVVAPDILKAKQTATTQRFKVHLITAAGEDLFTKVEFSRRKSEEGHVVSGPVSNVILRAYQMPPLLISHYDLRSAVTQKIWALAKRSVVQARDIFDLYILSSQGLKDSPKAPKEVIAQAAANTFGVSFKEFEDTVIAYLTPEDQAHYRDASVWDEIKLKVSDFIGETGKNHG